MEADILFLKRPTWAPRWVPRLRRVLGYSDVIGDTDHVRSAISEVFPGLEWHEAICTLPLSHARIHRVLWFGSGPPDFQITAGPANDVTMLFASDIGLMEIKLIEDRLGLVAARVYGEGLLEFIFA